MTRYAWLVLGAALGCAGAPSGITTLTAARVPVEYRVPSAAPRGDVRLASYGIALVKRENDKRKTRPTSALHVRAIVVDQADHGWVFDTRQQRVAIEGYGTSAPAFASANMGSRPPAVAVPPLGGERVIDLFFPLPEALQRTTTSPRFDVIWTVSTDVGPVSGRTSSEKLAVPPPRGPFESPFDYGPNAFWGPPYWQNPTYRDYEFRDAPALVSEPIAIQLAH